jgi:hypothetical protein
MAVKCFVKKIPPGLSLLRREALSLAQKCAVMGLTGKPFSAWSVLQHSVV